MNTKARGDCWERSEVNVKLTKRRRALLRELLGEEQRDASPTEALDIALAVATAFARRQDEETHMLEVLERGFDRIRLVLERLEDAAQATTQRVDGLCALITEVARAEE